jgi:hypothetical protein
MKIVRKTTPRDEDLRAGAAAGDGEEAVVT